MVTDNEKNEQLKNSQKDARISSVRSILVERVLVVALIVFFAANGMGFGDGFSLVTSLQTNVVLQPGNNFEANAIPAPGDYPKKSLQVSLVLNVSGDIRYAIDSEPTISSPIYPGYGLELYAPTKKTRSLNTVVIAPDLSLGPITRNVYNFVPDPVGLGATPKPNGQVELTWESSSDNDFNHYNVYLDKKLLNTTAFVSYTVSGLSLKSYEFGVSVVDSYGAESAITAVFTAPEGLEGVSVVVHSSAEDFVQGDFNGDGSVDVNDLSDFLNLIDGSQVLPVVDTVVQWVDRQI